MAEEVLGDGPILFIDVTNGTEQYPIIEVVSDTILHKKAATIKNEVPSPDPHAHIQPRRVRCTICQRYTAENEEKMLRHVRKVHRGENPFQCYMCDYSTYNKSLFEEHVRIHQGIKPFKCSHCPYRSVSKKNTKKHELIHRPNNPLKCIDCPFIARNHRVLNSHKEKTHSLLAQTLQSYSCTKCNRKFNDRTSYTNHRKSRKKCKVCDTSHCQHLLRTHEHEAHGLPLLKPGRLKVKKGELFCCEICKWSANSKPRILLHLIHHPNQDLDDCEVDLTVLRQCGILPQLGP